MESRRDKLMKRLEDPATYGDKRGQAIDWNRELAEIEESLPEVNARWEKLAGQLADLTEA